MSTAKIDAGTAWEIWMDGWRHGAVARKTERLIRTVYSGKPPDCPLYGGPCIGRLECCLPQDTPNS